MLLVTVALFMAQSAAPPVVWYTQLQDDQRVAEDGMLMPGRAIVRKGTILTIKGFLRDPLNPVVGLSGRVEARSNGDVRATADAKGDFTLTWDTRSESRAATKLEVRFRQDGQNQDALLRTCNLTFADSEPLTASVTQDGSGATVQLQTTGGLSADDPKYYINGVEVPQSGGRIQAKYLASPDEKATLQIVSQASRGGEKVGQISTTAAVAGSQGLTLGASKVGLTLPDNPFQTFFAFDVQGPMKDGSATLFVNGRAVPTWHENGRVTADPSFFRPDEGGVLWVKATAADGLSVFSRKVSVQELQIPATWIELATRIDEERARLRAVFSLRLGSFRNNSISGTLLRESGLYDKRAGQKESLTTVRLQARTTVFVRPNPGKAKPLRVAVTRKPIDIGGVAFKTIRVLPVFGSLNDFARDFKSHFGPGWMLTYEQDSDDLTLAEFISRQFDTAEMRRNLSFLGPYHRMLFSELNARLVEWAHSLEKARVSYETAKENPTRETIEAMIRALSVAEDQRLNANIIHGLLMVETGQPMPEITTYHFIPVARSQADTDVVTTKRYQSFDYVNTPIDIKMFP